LSLARQFGVTLFMPKKVRKTSKRAASRPPWFVLWYHEPWRGKADLTAEQTVEGQLRQFHCC
jgi:hypothetical protein